MIHSTGNQSVLDRLRESIGTFIAADGDLDQVQAALQSAMALLENDGSGVGEAVRLAEAVVEEIRFTRLLEEQRPAVTFRLDELLAELPGQSDG